MPKTKISEYSTTNTDNSDIEGINIAEGCAPSGINNAIREIMVHLKEFQTGASGDPLTVAGTFVASGGATIAASAGTSASPSIYFSGDTNTGVFSPAADTIAAATGGAERLRIDSSGNVGIGTSAPVHTLTVQRGATAGVQIAMNLNNPYEYGVGSGTAAVGIRFNRSPNNSGSTGVMADIYAGNQTETTSTTGFLAFATRTGASEVTTERMRIDSSGNVGIGTTSPANYANYKTLTIQGPSGGTGAELDWKNPSGTTVGAIYSTTTDFVIASDFTNAIASSNLTFTTDGSERMRITSAGEVLVGGTTAIESAPSLSIQGTNVAGALSLFRSDTTVVSGDNLGQVNFYGNDTTSNTPTRLAYVSAAASGTHAAGDNPTDLVFGCTNDGSETVDEFARLSGSSANSRSFTVRQPTLTNDNSSVVNAAGGTAGTLNRYASIATVKHSGITNACGALRVFAEDAAENWIWADNSDVLRISTTFANIGTTGGTVVGTQTSDERTKNIIGPVTYGLEQIKSINPVEFTLKDDAEQTKRIGFIAQQVQPIVPESVYDTKEVIVEGEPTKLGMEYVALIPVLVNAVKELSAKCDALQAEVNQLKGN